uniref:NADH dehydrogenase [ubiquinone] 1 subunit C2 n=1 Tax=Steinernema glaseri TaxID=37863 RepID=A0A1I7Y2C0_9BILA
MSPSFFIHLLQASSVCDRIQQEVGALPTCWSYSENPAPRSHPVCMSSSTIVSQQELERRESHVRAYSRQRSLVDPFTWTYPWKGFGVMAALSVGTIHLHNLWMKKPWYFAIVPRAALVGVVATLGYGMGMLREHHYRTRDAVVEHYVQLHPEDFDHLKDYHGRAYSKVLLPWYPRRTQYKQFDD